MADQNRAGRQHEDDEQEEPQGPLEIAIVGDLNDRASDITEKLLEVPMDGECILYFDSPGGSAYAAMSLLTIIAMRRLNATGIVTGECSSAALWPFAACRRRLVTPFSVLLFHPMKWQSEEHVHHAEATEWARHFGELEQTMDDVLARYLKMPRKKLAAWMRPGRYVSGAEFAAEGLAELFEI